MPIDPQTQTQTQTRAREWRRRDFCAAVAFPLALGSTKSRAAQQLVLLSHGGSYGEFVQQYFIAPFTKETGIPVHVVVTHDFAKVKAQVASGNPQWDLYDATGPQVFAGSRLKLWEPVPAGLVDAFDVPLYQEGDKVPVCTFSAGTCWNRVFTPRYKAPDSFDKFFDLKNFPGARVLRASAPESLEMALLADGVPPEAMYPLDVERAFKVLARVRPAVRQWVGEPVELMALVQAGAAEYGCTYGSAVRAAIDSGQSLAFGFAQTVDVRSYYAVLKGAKNREAAHRFIRFVLDPARQRQLGEVLGISPVSRKAHVMASHDAKKWMANPQNPKSVLLDDVYWGANYEALHRRFTDWVGRKQTT